MVQMLDKLSSLVMYFGMPVVTAYHLICGNVFLNTTAENATGLEKVADDILSPVQYLLCGKVAILKDGRYRLEQRFDYHQFLPEKSVLSIFSLPVSLPVGCLLKGLSFFSSETKQRHQMILAAVQSQEVSSLIPYYRSLGIPIDVAAEPLESENYKRRPGDEQNLKLERDLLRDIAALFKKNQIPFWVDCGTCIGAYRYGGIIPWDEDIDVAVLLPDFDNVMNALKALDQTKYCVEDWSNRCFPKTYVRVFIRENHNYVDIYHFAINPERRQVTYLLSNENSSFMLESWKIRERRFTVSSDYETVFPLRRANFDGIEVFVPNNTKKYLQERYGQDIRPVKIYSETTGEYERDLTHPYWQLPNVH